MSLPTAEELVTALNEYLDNPEEADLVESASSEALALNTQYLINCGLNISEGGDEAIPDPICLRACKETGADLFYRRTARNGIVGISSLDVSPIRLRRDPMTDAYALYAPYFGPGIA